MEKILETRIHNS